MGWRRNGRAIQHFFEIIASISRRNVCAQDVFFYSCNNEDVIFVDVLGHKILRKMLFPRFKNKNQRVVVPKRPDDAPLIIFHRILRHSRGPADGAHSLFRPGASFSTPGGTRREKRR